MKTAARFCGLLLTLSVVLTPFMDLRTAAGSQIKFPMLQLIGGGHRIRAEVASTLKSRDRGLMNRCSLPSDSGMLFVFPEAHRHCMWMRNTHIPLSIAFLEDDGTIVNIDEMRQDTDDYHCALKPVRYALEMNRRWFQQNGLYPGSRIAGLERAPHGQ